MSIEQQISDAVTDFHDLIANGLESSAALDEASFANGLKDGILEHHLSKKMPLEEIVNEIRREGDRKQTYETIYDAVLAYVSDCYRSLFKQPAQRRQEKLARLEAALGHPPSSEEQAQADLAEKKIQEEISIRFHREFARTLQNGRSQTNAAD